MGENIIGFNTKPADQLLTTKTCGVADADCHVVHSEWTIYVSATAEGVEDVIVQKLAEDVFALDMYMEILTQAADPEYFVGLSGHFTPATMTPIAAPSPAPASPTPAPTAIKMYSFFLPQAPPPKKDLPHFSTLVLTWTSLRSIAKTTRSYFILS